MAGEALQTCRASDVVVNHTFAPIPNWLLRREEISFAAKCGYARLHQYAQRKGFAFPTHQRLAKELGTTSRYVRDIIRELKEWRLIEVASQCGRNNTYKLLPNEWNSKQEDAREGSDNIPF